MRILLLNGPPSSGKDTFANHLSTRKYVAHESFAKPLKLANKAFFGLTDEQFDLYDTDPVEKEKNRPELLGSNWRQVNIDLAEKFIKKNFSKSVFGNLMVQRILNLHKDKDLIVISDSGFTKEAIPLVTNFDEDMIHCFKIYRDGCSYHKDSREYIDCSSLGITEHAIFNNSTVDEYIRECDFRLDKIMKSV